eukprot:CAMPEP_0176081576 /NCGR_PEP_ID=MMETSP0120_2-20121206/40805_1 /TAXON_ID=160619 /ORGANISM="Kryptoperidinium foliaceum, Strain CCMP 1326" /LENGTH=223 /DNA_ID=CAMNT_0017415343 /DNA_START=78 /DNA_END=749 /DNA_ORIENTATION=-
MALLCPAGEMASQQHPRVPAEYCREGTISAHDGMEREDSRLPLLGAPSMRLAVPDALGVEHERAIIEAVSLISEQLTLLKGGRRALNRTETSELLRDTCQALADLVIGLDGAWRKAHPNEPMPPWPVNAIPEEELAHIGWDFHANRVQMIRNTGGSIWESIAFLMRGDEQAGFAKPPSAGAVAEALSKAADRLGRELQASTQARSVVDPQSERLRPAIAGQTQ